MNKIKLIFKTVAALLLSAALFASCNNEDDQLPDNNEKIPFSGAYVWNFEIPGMGNQKSTHIFYNDSIVYKMEGIAYNTQYTQLFESYDPDEKRLITVGKGGSIPKDGVYFVMFFKDVTANTITIYKRECTGGKEEAQTFAYPEENATTDHGWNVYTKE